MNILFKTNIKKIIREKSCYIIFILITILLLIPAFLNNSNAELDKLKFYEENLRSNNDFIKNTKDDPTAIHVIEDVKESVKYLEEITIAIKEKDTKAKLKAELKYETKNLNDMFAGTLSGIPLLEQEKKVAELKFLDENNMEKVSIDENQSTAMNYFIELFSSESTTIIILLSVTLIVNNLLLLDKKNAHSDFINSTPISLIKLSAVKFFTVTCVSILIIFTSFIIVFVTISSLKGVGEVN